MTRNTMFGVIAIGILVTAKWLFIPWAENVKDQRAKIEQLTFTSQKLSNLPERAEAANNFLSESVNLGAIIEKRSYSGSNSALISSAILSDLKRIATQSNVEIKNQSLGELKPGDISLLPVSAYVEGSVENIATFFNELEKDSGKLFLVNSATVAKAKRGDGLRVNMQLFVMVNRND